MAKGVGTNMADVVIRVRDNGPLIVEGEVTIVDGEGNTFPLAADKPAVALCRCGASKNMPFCDGSHRGCGFESQPRAESGG